MYAARGRPPHVSHVQWQRTMSAGAHLWEHMGDAPVLLVACMRAVSVSPKETLPSEVQARDEDELAYIACIRGASIYPAVQNIILACRALGLGTVITTNHIRLEEEVKAQLGLPDEVSTYALMPIGYPVGKFGPVSRKPLSQVVYADSWGNAWPGQ